MRVLVLLLLKQQWPDESGFRQDSKNTSAEKLNQWCLIPRPQCFVARAPEMPPPGPADHWVTLLYNIILAAKHDRR